MSIRFSFPGEPPVELCAPLRDDGFNVRYAAAGPGPSGAECTLLSAGADSALVAVGTGTVNWWFRGYGNMDWFARLGPVPIGMDTDVVVAPHDCGAGPGDICDYASYTADGGGCRMEVRRAGAARGDPEELALTEPCRLLHRGPDRSPGPTIEALRMQSPISIITVNARDPSQPPAFECPL